MKHSKEQIKNYARLAGVFYLLCMVTSIMGGRFINNVFERTELFQAVKQNSFTLGIGTCLELINAVGVIAIACAFYVELKKVKPFMATVYVILRSVEAALCMMVAFIPVFVIMLINRNHSFVQESDYVLLIIIQLRTMFWSYFYPVLFILSGLLFYWMLFDTRIVPRYIATWGGLALIGVFGAMFVPQIKFIPGIFIITNEIYLGVYLLIKGFKRTIKTSKVEY